MHLSTSVLLLDQGVVEDQVTALLSALVYHIR